MIDFKLLLIHVIAMKKVKDRKLEKTVPDLPENKKRRSAWKPLFEDNSKLKEQLNAILINAVITGKLDKVKELVAEGADVNAADERGRTALKYALFIQGPDGDISKFLKSKGAKENIN